MKNEKLISKLKKETFDSSKECLDSLQLSAIQGGALGLCDGGGKYKVKINCDSKYKKNSDFVDSVSKISLNNTFVYETFSVVQISPVSYSFGGSYTFY